MGKFVKGQIPWNKGTIGVSTGRPKGMAHTEETKKKISVSRKGKPAWNRGIPMTEKQQKILIACSKGRPPWNKGKQMSDEYRKKVEDSRSMFQKGHTPWNKGGHHSIETIIKVSESKLKSEKTSRGENHPFYIDGKGRERGRERHTRKFMVWRDSVYERDGYTCKTCGDKGTGLHAHHIKSFAHYPELRFNINNGLTLCEECHMKLHGLWQIARMA
jgi:hypothetical protein